MAKRLLVAYWLWALGGPLGLHHVYLGRDSHALLWLVTLGGFGAGWLCDLPQLPTWVAAANGTRMRQRHRAGTAPAPGALCFAAQLAAGIYLGTLVGLALPWAPAVPLGAALGVQLAASAAEQTVAAPVGATEGMQRGDCQWGDSLGTDPCPHPACQELAFSQRGATRGHFQGTGPCPPSLMLRGAPSGVQVGDYRGRGSPRGLVPASPRSLCILPIFLQVLGLSAGCSTEDVHRSYRELVKVWHPDHNRHRAKEAERRFIELQEAYEVLVGPRRAAAA
ncbi:DJC22 protein, partial [Nothocercus julius]|nr:DJC22 protein [Nothocercus julius]